MARSLNCNVGAIARCGLLEVFLRFRCAASRKAGESDTNQINQGVEHMKSLRRTRLHTGICEVDGDLFERSRLARAGRSLVQLAVFIRAIEPALALVAALLIVAVPALAQTPGGNLFGGNDQQLGSGVREAIRWGRNLLFLLGVAGVGMGSGEHHDGKSLGQADARRRRLYGHRRNPVAHPQLQPGERGQFRHRSWKLKRGAVMRPRPIRPNIYLPVARFGVLISDWKFVFVATLIAYSTPFLFDLKLWGAPLELWTGLGAAALSIAFFNYARIGRRPFWLQHRLRAMFTSPIHRRALPIDGARRPKRRWIIAE